MPCPLCPISISTEMHDEIWEDLRSGGYPAALRKARLLGHPITKREARAHFEYHCPRQGRASASKASENLEYIRKTTDRRRLIVDLLFRVPGLTGEVVGRSIHWNGVDLERSLFVADKAAHRDLKILIRDNFAHRVFLKNLKGPGARPTDLKGKFFVGVNGRSYIEHVHHIELKPTDVLRDQSDLADWRLMYPQFQANDVIAKLQLDLPGNQHMRFAAFDGIHVGWDIRNWLGSHLLPEYDDPLKESKRVKADGMAALSVKIGDEIRLLPFFYHVDLGNKVIDRLISDLHSPLHFERSGTVNQVFPAIHHSTVIPSVIICKDHERLETIREASLKESAHRERFLAIATTEEAFNLMSPSFSRLFYPPGETRSLISALLRFYERFPVRASVLEWRGIRPDKNPRPL